MVCPTSSKKKNNYAKRDSRVIKHDTAAQDVHVCTEHVKTESATTRNENNNPSNPLHPSTILEIKTWMEKEMKNALTCMEKSFMSKIHELERQLNSLDNENKILKKTIEKLEKRITSKSLVIHGLPEFNDETSEETEQSTHELLKELNCEDVLLENTMRIGKPSDQYCRPVLITTVTTAAKHKILKAKKLLKEKPENTISIQPERTSEEQRKYVLLREFCNEKDGKIMGVKAYIRNSELHIQLHDSNMTYIVNENYEVIEKKTTTNSRTRRKLSMIHE